MFSLVLVVSTCDLGEEFAGDRRGGEEYQPAAGGAATPPARAPGGRGAPEEA